MNVKILLCWFITLISFLNFPVCYAEENILNLYTWSGVMPESTIRQFEKETGIKVNFSTYNSNEIMYAKLRTNPNSGYDILEPSSYYVDRMVKQGMLEKMDKTKLSHFKNLSSDFLNKKYDPHNTYSIPFIWGVTGIFVNSNFINTKTITKWANLWDPKYRYELVLLDDSREVFSIALCALGFSVNDNDPVHIEAAYEKLKSLMPNVKLFNSDAVVTIMVDEDANLGMAWNGDLLKAQKENSALRFIFPQDSFVIWVDNFVIPKNAPHLQNAYKFLNFILRADIAKAITLKNNFPTPNLAARKLLPNSIKNNTLYYPPSSILKKGQFQTDVDTQALELYEKYWEKLKIGADQ